MFTRSNLVTNRIIYFSLVTVRTRVKSAAETNKAFDKTEGEIKNGNRTVYLALNRTVNWCEDNIEQWNYLFKPRPSVLPPHQYESFFFTGMRRDGGVKIDSIFPLSSLPLKMISGCLHRGEPAFLLFCIKINHSCSEPAPAGSLGWNTPYESQYICSEDWTVRFSVCCNVYFRIHSRCLHVWGNTIAVSARKVLLSESPVQFCKSASVLTRQKRRTGKQRVGKYIQGVPGGMDKTSGKCSLCWTIPL